VPISNPSRSRRSRWRLASGSCRLRFAIQQFDEDDAADKWKILNDLQRHDAAQAEEIGHVEP